MSSLNTFEDPLHLTDAGNAARFVREHHEKVKYCGALGAWFQWNGRRWTRDSCEQRVECAKETASKLFQDAGRVAQASPKLAEAIEQWARKSEGASRIEAMIRLARSDPKIAVDPDVFDRDPWALNCSNGTLDLRTGALRPHNRNDMISKLAPTMYDPAARAPRWESFLTEVLPDPDLREYVRRAVGYSITGDVSEQVLFFAYGSGANGKSTFINAILAILGVGDDAYSKQAAPNLLTLRKGERHPVELADLRGARFITTVEIDDGERFAESLLKQLTGGDLISARKMRENFSSFRPTCKIWIAANHRPRVRGTDHAIWRRIHVLPFTVRIEKPDRNLQEKLQAESPGVLNWALQGAREWHQQGLDPPRAVLEATETYRRDEDVLGEFLEAQCVCETGAKVKLATLHEKFSQEQPGWTSRRFTGALRERNFQTVRASDGTYILGLRGKNELGTDL
jgi:putative DNA primase/helicase